MVINSKQSHFLPTAQVKWFGTIITPVSPACSFKGFMTSILVSSSGVNLDLFHVTSGTNVSCVHTYFRTNLVEKYRCHHVYVKRCFQAVRKIHKINSWTHMLSFNIRAKWPMIAHAWRLPLTAICSVTHVAHFTNNVLFPSKHKEWCSKQVPCRITIQSGSFCFGFALLNRFMIGYCSP